MPKFVKKDNYGTVPKYLEARKKQMAEHQANYEQYIQQRLQKGALNQVTAAERYRKLTFDHIYFNINHDRHSTSIHQYNSDAAIFCTLFLIDS